MTPTPGAEALAALVRRNHATVDLGALCRNLGRIRARLQPGAELLCMVKADAYGHGAVACSQAFVEAGVGWLGVALVEEGVELREAGLGGPSILVLGGAFGQRWDLLLRHRLTPALSSAEDVAAYGAAAAAARVDDAPFHLKLDTGMARLGIPVAELEARLPALRAAMGQGPLRLEGVMSHFASADLGLAEVTRRQIADFAAALRALGSLGGGASGGGPPPRVHLSNSAACLLVPEAHHSLVRPGIALYGYPPTPAAQTAPPLEPVLRWSTEVVQIRDVPAGTGISYGHRFVTERPTRVATLAVGYADGYRRGFGNVADVVIRGQRCRLLGVVCMDLCMADVSAVDGVRPGDPVELIGPTVSAEELAQHAGTISYEILCAIGRRVPRVYRAQ